MGGGLMQLVAYGAQDIYLTGNPQITFFKVVYRRHTNFAIEAIEQTFNGSAELGKRVSCTVARNGDLLYRVYLELNLKCGQVFNDTSLSCASDCGQPGLPDNHNVIKGGCSPTCTENPSGKYGFGLIDYVEVEIGGQVMDGYLV